jgi:hypothetical protein
MAGCYDSADSYCASEKPRPRHKGRDRADSKDQAKIMLDRFREQRREVEVATKRVTQGGPNLEDVGKGYLYGDENGSLVKIVRGGERNSLAPC